MIVRFLAFIKKENCILYFLTTGCAYNTRKKNTKIFRLTCANFVFNKLAREKKKQNLFIYFCGGGGGGGVIQLFQDKEKKNWFIGAGRWIFSQPHPVSVYVCVFILG